MIGAILTQNTAWRNVERALGALRDAGLLVPERLARLAEDELADLIRPAGFHNQKARRIMAFMELFRTFGFSEQRLAAHASPRELLLAVRGIGPETADCILLYALGLPFFVIDGYTRRLLFRLGITATDDIAYDRCQRFLTDCMPPDVVLYNEFHALVVAHAKTSCTARPRCGSCVLASRCRRQGVGP